jgi:hypothetical protein
MADTLTLGKRRTVRFSSTVDRLLESRAAVENKPVSTLIRDSVVAGLQAGNLTAGEWILRAAKGRPRHRAGTPADIEFQKLYRERHQ